MTTRRPHSEIDLLTARYLEAFEIGDAGELETLWQLAANDPALTTALTDLHAGLLEEMQLTDDLPIIQTAVTVHLPSAEIVRPDTEPLTVADAAGELRYIAPPTLSPEAHAFNARLLTARTPLPAELGLSKFIAWAQLQFGTAPSGYWRALQQVALTLALRRSAEVDFRLAARKGRP